MLQQETPEDYVIATGQMHSVRECVEIAFKEVGIDILWEGSGLDECGIDSATGNIVVRVDAAYLRPAEVELLVGDAQKAKKNLGWKPRISFEDLIKEMVAHDEHVVKSSAVVAQW